MHHYVGKFSLLSTAQGGRKAPLISGYRGGLFKIDGNHFGSSIELIDQTELKPGETAKVHVTFLAPKALNLVTSQIQLGCSYEICEGAKPIGNLLIEGSNQEKNDLTKYLSEFFLVACKKTGIAPTQFILTVNIAGQTVSLFEQTKFVKQFPCSTSRFGIGQTEGSNRTPLGLHRIAEKIGAGEPAGTIFKARQIIGHTSQPEFADAKITTRILWLEGLEPGLNKGFNGGVNVDSHARYIYIHGTADQKSIGQPASHGCIHLADADLIPLFDLLPGGTLVWIFE